MAPKQRESRGRLSALKRSVVPTHPVDSSPSEQDGDTSGDFQPESAGGVKLRQRPRRKRVTAKPRPASDVSGLFEDEDEGEGEPGQEFPPPESVNDAVVVPEPVSAVPRGRMAASHSDLLSDSEDDTQADRRGRDRVAPASSLLTSAPASLYVAKSTVAPIPATPIVTDHDNSSDSSPSPALRKPPYRRPNQRSSLVGLLKQPSSAVPTRPSLAMHRQNRAQATDKSTALIHALTKGTLGDTGMRPPMRMSGRFGGTSDAARRKAARDRQEEVDRKNRQGREDMLAKLRRFTRPSQGGTASMMGGRTLMGGPVRAKETDSAPSATSVVQPKPPSQSGHPIVGQGVNAPVLPAAPPQPVTTGYQAPVSATPANPYVQSAQVTQSHPYQQTASVTVPPPQQRYGGVPVGPAPVASVYTRPAPASSRLPTIPYAKPAPAPGAMYVQPRYGTAKTSSSMASLGHISATVRPQEDASQSVSLSPEVSRVGVDTSQVQPSDSLSQLTNDPSQQPHIQTHGVSRHSTAQIATGCVPLEDLGVPWQVAEVYRDEIGVPGAYDWQKMAVETACSAANVHRNFVYSAPTGSGKSLVAEILMMRALQNAADHGHMTKARALVVEPFIATAQERFDSLNTVCAPLGYTVEGFFGSRQPRGGFITDDCDIAVCTYERAVGQLKKLTEYPVEVGTKEGNQLSSSTASADNVVCVVVDEVHMIGESGRGALLELFLTLARATLPGCRFIATSATMSNIE
ncbi:hypothetical protein KIPB_007072, partial [Kipferlia bialata]|eukprot:g7072.t1